MSGICIQSDAKPRIVHPSRHVAPSRRVRDEPEYTPNPGERARKTLVDQYLDYFQLRPNIRREQARHCPCKPRGRGVGFLKIGAIAMLPFDPPQRDIVAVTQLERSEPSLSAIEDRIESPPEASVGHDDQVAIRVEKLCTAEEFAHTPTGIVVRSPQAPSLANWMLTHRSGSFLYRHGFRVAARPIDRHSARSVRLHCLPSREPIHGQRVCAFAHEKQVLPREVEIHAIKP
jgi:hypothetical protein